jgi:spore coat polysaccharide biosynthesis predicted glycosyltransferase SpsG
MNRERETPGGLLWWLRLRDLRDQFRGQHKEVRDEPRLVLLSFGGSDPQGLTLKTARALQGLPAAINVVAVAGPAFSYRREFEALERTLARRVPLIQEATGHMRTSCWTRTSC